MKTRLFAEREATLKTREPQINQRSNITGGTVDGAARISIITLGVADLELSRRFYERLGWRRSMLSAEGIVFFQAGGMALALFPRNELAKDVNTSAVGQGFSGITLAHTMRSRQEVDSVLAEAVTAGAKLSKSAQDVFWGGYSGYFSDPDGFLWEVAWNPHFPIADDGSIQIPD